jgi:hypothetical protein
MTYEEGISFNKAKADMFNKLAKGQTYTFQINHSYNITVKVISVRDPKSSSTHAHFPTNVKVISCIKSVVSRDVNNKVIVGTDGKVVYEGREVCSVPRSRVNSANNTIRNKVQNELGKYAPIFSIAHWCVRADKVIWP